MDFAIRRRLSAFARSDNGLDGGNHLLVLHRTMTAVVASDDLLGPGYDFKDRADAFITTLLGRSFAFDADLRGSGRHAAVYLATVP